MSSKRYLKASISFLDPSLNGASLAEVAGGYQPLLKLTDEYLTSCVFVRIGDGAGTMKLGLPYEVYISMHLAPGLEQHFGKSIRELLPPGRKLDIVTIPERIVAVGVSGEVVELEVGTDGRPRAFAVG